MPSERGETHTTSKPWQIRIGTFEPPSHPSLELSRYMFKRFHIFSEFSKTIVQMCTTPVGMRISCHSNITCLRAFPGSRSNMETMAAYSVCMHANIRSTYISMSSRCRSLNAHVHRCMHYAWHSWDTFAAAYLHILRHAINTLGSSSDCRTVRDQASH